MSKIYLNEFRVFEMNGNVSASVLKCRPSVIKWVGKNFTADLNSKTDGRDSSTVGSIQAYTMSAQEHKQSKGSDESSKDQQAINNESLFPKSSNAERKYDCLICKKSFKWRSHWKSHQRIHTGERPFQCGICGKTFTRSDGLQCHKKVHFKIAKPCSTANQPYYVLGNNIVQDATDLKQDNVLICAYCGRTFGSVAGYYRHTDKKHKDKEDLKCRICNIIFNRPSALKIHNRVHTGLKPYRCDICSKAFSVRGNLKRHLFIHSGERPYNCTYCSSCFNNSSHLARHVKSKHNEQSSIEE